MSSLQDKYTEPTAIKIANKTLGLLLPESLKDAIVGDLREEHFIRASKDFSSANKWVWRQLFITSFYAINSALRSDRFLQYVVLILCLLGLPIIISMVAWLSNMDETSPYIWNQLLEANMHIILFDGYFWSQIPESIIRIEHITMYIHYGSVVWSVIALLIMCVIKRMNPVSAHQIALMGAAAMLLPYLMGWMYINTMLLAPTDIGPILAFMLFNILYMLIPVTYWVLKTANRNIILVSID